MRITLVIEPGPYDTFWANILDCDRIVQKHSEFIYENYDALSEILVFTPSNIFDYIEEKDYFTIYELCRYKKMDQILKISKDWDVYAIKSNIIKKESKDYYIHASLKDLLKKQQLTL